MSALKSAKLLSNSKVVRTGLNIVLAKTQRFFGTAPKPQLADVEHRVTRKSFAGLTARSPYPLTQQNPLGLMPPLRSVQPNKLNFFNANPQPLDNKDSSTFKISRQTMKLIDLMEEQNARDQRAQDSEDQLWGSSVSRQDMQRVPKRSIEHRQAGMHPPAKELGPPEEPEVFTPNKIHYGPISKDSATYLVATRFLNEEPPCPQAFQPANIPDSTLTPPDMTTRKPSLMNILQPDVVPPKRSFPRPGNVSITNPTDITSRKQQSIMNTIRPDYPKVAQLSAEPANTTRPMMITRKGSMLRIVQLANGDTNSPKNPINVVRPNIPPINYTTQHSQSALNMQKLREEKLEESDKSHKSRLYKWVLTITGRKIP